MNTNTFQYLLRLADSNVILGHRLSEWCGHGPILEEDIAMTNMALDLVGTATAFYEYAATLDAQGRSADDLAYLRDVYAFRNNLLTEQPNGDFAVTMLRQFFYSAFSLPLYQQLVNSKDETIAGIAAKAVKEATYHLRHSSQWIIRLGGGTEESALRLKDAVTDLWQYTGDMFDTDERYTQLVKEGIAADMTVVKQAWLETLKHVFAEAHLSLPEEGWQMKGSLQGKHTEHLGYLLAEMQFLPRAYPGAQW